MKPLLLIPVLLLAGCRSETARRASAPETPPVPVKTAQAAEREWPDTYEATGTVRARTTATVASKITGYVQQVNGQVGDHVRAGQLLIVLDSRDLDVNVHHAEAARADVQSAIPELESATAAAKANLDLAQSTFARMQQLFNQKSISSQEMDEASARLKSAQANYEMARARRAQLTSKTALVEQDVRAASIMRDYAKLSAPFAGVITAKSVEPGNLAAPGVPLLTIEQEGSYRLEASIDESQLPAVRAGQPVDAIVDSSDTRFSTRVSEVVPAVDPASRTYIVKLDLPPTMRLRTGMFGRAFFSRDSRKAVAIPPSALVERGQLQSVFAIENNVAHTRLVTVGRRAPDGLEILSGLTAGETIVLSPPSTLQDGARVGAAQ